MKQNFKRVAAAVLALCITAGAMPVLRISSPVTTAYAAEEEGTLVEKNGMVYREYSDYISLIYCEPDGDTLYIPDMIDGKPVTEIDGYAFTDVEDYPELPDSVKKVMIPEGVEVIGDHAFASEGSENLREVHFPSTLKKVEWCAFSNNYRLNAYDLPETAELESCSFANTFFAPESRINFIIKDEMSYIDYPDHVAMVYCEPDGDTVYFPDTVDGKPVTEIATRYEFYDISKASRYLEIPYFNDDIRKVYIPEGVEIVSTVLARSSLFSDECEGIYEVYLPSTLKKVRSYAFAGNKHLNVYGLPETAEIGRFAFEGTCYDVESRANLVIKNGMIYADYSDHIDMIYCEPEGDTLYIPDMIDGKPVTEIHGNQAALLHKIDVEVEIPSLPDTVKKVYIPEGVEVIGSDVFECDSVKEGLYEVYLPSTLKKVCDGAFNGNKHLNVYGLPETADVATSEYAILGRVAFWGTRYDVKKRSNIIEKNGMIYEEYPDYIRLYYCESDGDTLYIPDMIDGKPVKEICGFSDEEDDDYNYLGIIVPTMPDAVKTVYIPEGVEEIYPDSFACPADKEGLYEVYLPSTLKKVWVGSFSGNKRLNVYGLPETAEIDSWTFESNRFFVKDRSNLIEKNGMIYMEYPDHIMLYYCEPDGDTLYIPDMIDGKPVTEIADDTFIMESCYVYDYGFDIPSLPDSVKEVIIPEGVVVREGAFAGTKFEGQFTTTPVSEVMYGDANLDGKITLADSLAILQFIANEDKYPLSEQAQKNADCFNPGDGITGNDAVAVMRYDTKIVSKLPIIEK